MMRGSYFLPATPPVSSLTLEPMETGLWEAVTCVRSIRWIRKDTVARFPNGRVGRSGTGKIAIWNLNTLPTHEEAKHGIIGGLLDLSYYTVEDVYDIEESIGSKPGAILTLETEPKLKIFRWHIHLSQPGVVLAGSDPNIGPRNSHDPQADGRCLALDLEHGGKTVIEYSDHRGRINGFSTSKGDPNAFTTAAKDGYARMFDVRMEAPPFALRAGPGKECTGAVLCHPDGIPCACPVCLIFRA